MSTQPPPPNAQLLRPRRSRPAITPTVLVALLAIVIAAIMLIQRLPRLTLSHDELGDLVHATLQREVPAAFLVTGELQVTASTRVRNTKTLLPGLLDVDLGTTSAAVRVPGRIIYGFDAAALGRDDITVYEDGVILITLPEPRVFAVEPSLSEMEIETRRGWARLSRETEQQVRERAIELVENTLRAQGARHLETSTQPRINSAQAIAAILRPAFVAAGIDDPVFRFVVGPSLTWEDRPDS